jgi:c-di-GMP-binding flagellar brake protein YcgR
MGVPRWDFSTTEETQSARRLPGFDGGKAALPSWVNYLVAGLLLGGLAAVLIHRWLRNLEKKQKRLRAWKAARALCQEKKLTGDEISLTLSALRDVGSVYPNRDLTSESYFGSTLAAELKRRSDEATCERISRKLFHGGIDEQEEALEKKSGGTRELAAGKKLRLHFDGLEGSFASTVINVAEKNFVVTLPMAGEKKSFPTAGARVEGFMAMGNVLYAFESKVEETFLGGVFACRIAHVPDMKQICQRSNTRVTLKQKIVFSHFPGGNISSGHIDFGTLEKGMASKWEGQLQDISVGGCALQTKMRHNFEVGDFVKFEARIIEDAPAHTLLGAIVHVSPVPVGEGGGRHLHVQFLGLEEEAEDSINRAVYRLGEKNTV